MPSHGANGRGDVGTRLASVARMTDVVALRARIDELDSRLLELVSERREVSREIQALRTAAGDTTVSPAREQQIRQAYADALGEHGADLAAAVLVVCRGRH